MGTPAKGHADYLEIGDWNAACAVCGRKYKASEMIQLPAGIAGAFPSNMYVCRRDWRPRQAQDFVRGIPDKISPPWQQPWLQTYQSVAYEPTVDDPTVEIDLCGNANGASNIVVMIAADQYIPVLTIPLGTGAAKTVIVNIFGTLGNIITTTSSDPCLPSAVTITQNIGTLANTLDFGQQPTGTFENGLLTPAVTVQMLKPSGAVDTTFTGDIVISIGNNPSGGVLAGTTTQAAIAGVATFDDLSIDVAGTGYTLVATTTGLLVTSAAFTITTPAFTQSLVYTLTGGDVWGLGGVQDSARSFYNGVVWANYGANVGNAPFTNVAVFNLAAQSTPITQAVFGAYRNIGGVIEEETTPPGFAVMASTGANIYRMDFEGSASFFDAGVSDARNSLNGIALEDSQQALFAPSHVGGVTGRPLFRWSTINWAAGTAVLDSNFGSLAASYYFTQLIYNPTVIDSRVYCLPATNVAGNPTTPFYLSWVHSLTGVITNLVTFANACTGAVLAGQFEGGADTLLYNMSGDEGAANVLQKRTLDGMLLGSVSLPGMSASDFTNGRLLAYDYINNMLWVQLVTGSTIYCVNCTSMEVVASGDPNPVVRLVQPIGHPSGGAVALELNSPLNRLYRISLG